MRRNTAERICEQNRDGWWARETLGTFELRKSSNRKKKNHPENG